MKNTEIDEKVERHISKDEKRSDKTLYPESKRTVTIEDRVHNPQGTSDDSLIQ